MTINRRPPRGRHCGTALAPALALAVALAAGSTAPAEAGDAKGTLSHRGAPIAVRYAYLVKGPDAIDPKMIVRKLILSATDLEAKIRACTTMSCADSDLNDGMTVDFDAGPRLNYWVVRNKQMIQHSGTAAPAVYTAARNEAGHLSGKLVFDSSGSGGPKVELEFDAALLKEFTAAR
ncbi:MAG: hypothetical protein FJX57_06875 [Alphaproteobacteria bacterium]|nr:hypothetical protein [Alphaproteobacteria bacterium]